MGIYVIEVNNLDKWYPLIDFVEIRKKQALQLLKYVRSKDNKAKYRINKYESKEA